MEFDDIQLAGDASQQLDFEVFMWNDADPATGVFDVYFAYDNVAIDNTLGTIGVENDDGTKATALSFDEFTPTDGLVVCMDWSLPSTIVEITYAATFDDAFFDFMDAIVNAVSHNTDTPGSREATTSATVTVGMKQHLPIVIQK